MRAGRAKTSAASLAVSRAVRTAGNATENRGALLEFREVLDRSQRAFGTVDTLIEDSAQAHGVDPKPRSLRASIRVLVEGAIGVPVGVAIQARDA